MMRVVMRIMMGIKRKNMRIIKMTKRSMMIMRNTGIIMRNI